MHSGTLPEGAMRVLTASAVMVSGYGHDRNARDDIRKFEDGFHEKFLSLGGRGGHIVYIAGYNNCIGSFGLGDGNQLTAGIALLF